MNEDQENFLSVLAKWVQKVKNFSKIILVLHKPVLESFNVWKVFGRRERLTKKFEGFINTNVTVNLGIKN